MYASDTRNGKTAFGTADLRPPAAPAVPAARIATPAAAKLPRTRNPKDDIATLGFDPNTAPSVERKPNPKP